MPRHRYLSYLAHPMLGAILTWRALRRGHHQRALSGWEAGLRRGRRDRYWCGGRLNPSPFQGFARCASCGCWVNDNPPITEELQALYGMKAYWQVRCLATGSPPLTLRPLLYRVDGRLAAWEGLVDRYAPKPGSALEVGCCPGVLLEALSHKGWRCLGVEPSAETAAWIHGTTGVEVRAGMFPQVDLPSCDLFLAMDVLEHSEDPQAFLGMAAQLLNPGGIAIIQCPVARPECERPFPGRADIFDTVEHMFIFTDRALALLADRCGLDIVSQREAIWATGEVTVLRKPLA